MEETSLVSPEELQLRWRSREMWVGFLDKLTSTEYGTRNSSCEVGKLPNYLTMFLKKKYRNEAHRLKRQTHENQNV